MMTYSTDHKGNYNGPKFGPISTRQATAAEWAEMLPQTPPSAWFASFDAAALAASEQATYAARVADEVATRRAAHAARMADRATFDRWADGGTI